MNDSDKSVLIMKGK